VGDENICRNIGDAIARAETLHHERHQRRPVVPHERQEARA